MSVVLGGKMDKTHIGGSGRTSGGADFEDEPSLSRLMPGDLVVNSYRITREVSRGGMGALFEGEHDITGERVAIKAVLEQHAGEERALKLFEREAMALSKVKHDAIVGYRDILRDAHNRLFIIMDFIDGSPLSHYVGRATLPPEGVDALGLRLASGLAAAHAANVTHRDMSPKNILLPDGDIEKAVIIDFGIAKHMSADAGTMIGSHFAGTLGYASPEQLGLFDGQVDQRSDIYAVGLILAEVAGVKLDIGTTFADAVIKRQNDLSLPERVSSGLRLKIERLLRANPADRPATMAEAWPPGLELDEKASTQDDETTGLADLSEDASFESRGGVARGNPPVVDQIQGPTGGEAERPNRGQMMLWGGIAAVLALAAGIALFASDEITGLASLPTAEQQARQALEIVQDASKGAPEKRQAAATLLASGSEDQMSVAIGVLRALSNEGDAAASLRIGELYDPEFFSPETSPFSKASTRSALRWYRKAADQGSADAAGRISRLEAE